MPTLVIDNISVEVAEGTNILEAARQAGIVIPHFCWHPALDKAGACRVCAVKIVDGPVKGLQMSCMVPAQDGMVVSTTDEEALAMRRQVIEWLMINHPHDCPVCDEGGECQLQDFTIAGGHGIRRYDGRKRTFLNQFLGPYIEHEMNRCIQCYRCARFYQEYAGGTDFGVTGRAGMVYFGRQQDGPLESPFSGNLVDICPTGVFTDKTARFRARYWDYSMAPSVCPHCSLGCNTIPAARYRELLKVMARRNDAVNGWFICDRGRFSNSAVNDPLRPRTPLVDGQPVDWNEALETLLRRIGEVQEIYGEGSVAVVGSSRLSLEGGVLLPVLAEAIAAGVLCYFSDEREADCAAAAVSSLNAGNTASMADVQTADCIAIVECDLLDEGPMLALAVRQAWRRGGRIFMVGPQHSHQGMFECTPAEALGNVPLHDAKRPVIICSALKENMGIIEEAAGYGTKLVYTFSGPNSFGAALLSREYNATSLSQTIAGGTVKGIIAVEADIPTELLEGIPFVAALDWVPTDVVKNAQIVLPTTAWVEMDGTFINNESRAQRFRQVMRPGVPIKGLDAAGHPPRVHRVVPPGGDVHPAWKVAAMIIERLGGEPVNEPLAEAFPDLQELGAEGEGTKVLKQ